MTAVRHGEQCDSDDADLHVGDKIVKVNGDAIDASGIQEKKLLDSGGAGSVQVVRAACTERESHDYCREDNNECTWENDKDFLLSGVSLTGGRGTICSEIGITELRGRVWE